MAVSPKELLRHAEALRNEDRRRARQAYWFFAGLGRRPEPTPSDSPDRYGDPDPEWLGIDWREHLKTVEVDGARINYVEMGEGPALVLVHGLSGCWQNWLEQIPRFARHHRVLALDLPGFGRSPLPPWDISIPRYGELLDGFCRTLNVHSSTLVGNSMGGFISAEAAIAQPDWVEKLVLVSAAGITHARMRKEPAEMAARMAAAAAPLALRFQAGSLQRPRMRWAAFRGVFHAPQRMRPELLWEQYHGAMGAPGFLPAVQTLVGYDFTDRLENVAVPTLIVWGRNDRIVPPADAQGYAKHLSNSRVVIFDQCGHCPQLERPLRFNRLLEEFLADGFEAEGGELARAAAPPTIERAPEADTVE
jgi:pimeloyl-ACP methyl ester carboxylesterase